MNKCIDNHLWTLSFLKNRDINLNKYKYNRLVWLYNLALPILFGRTKVDISGILVKT